MKIAKMTTMPAVARGASTGVRTLRTISMGFGAGCWISTGRGAGALGVAAGLLSGAASGFGLAGGAICVLKALSEDESRSIIPPPVAPRSARIFWLMVV